MRWSRWKQWEAHERFDDIVKKVRFPDWQHTTQGERLVQKELRKTLLKYKLHTDQDLFDREYAVVGKMCRLYEMGIRHVATMHNFGALAPSLVERSMTMFAREVMPAVAARVGATAFAS